jgi:hypothetical protein
MEAASKTVAESGGLAFLRPIFANINTQENSQSIASEMNCYRTIPRKKRADLRQTDADQRLMIPELREHLADLRQMLSDLGELIADLRVKMADQQIDAT